MLPTGVAQPPRVGEQDYECRSPRLLRSAPAVQTIVQSSPVLVVLDERFQGILLCGKLSSAAVEHFRTATILQVRRILAPNRMEQTAVGVEGSESEPLFQGFAWFTATHFKRIYFQPQKPITTGKRCIIAWAYSSSVGSCSSTGKAGSLASSSFSASAWIVVIRSKNSPNLP